MRKRDAIVDAFPYVRFVLACCGLCAALLAGSFPALCQQKKPIVYRGIVPIDDALFSDGNLCVPLAVGMTSGDFFEGLRGIPTPAGRRFYKYARQVTEFPGQITVFVRASMLGCVQFPYVPVSNDDARSLMGALNFSLEWQSQTGRRSAEILSSKVISPGPAVWPENQKPIPVWSCIFTIKAKGIPLTDDLVVTMRSE